MDMERFNSVFSDSEFVNKILSAGTGERVKWLLKENELMLEDKDLDYFAAALVKSIESKYKETLDSQDLENISGGADQKCVDNYKMLEKIRLERVNTWIDFSKVQI